MSVALQDRYYRALKIWSQRHGTTQDLEHLFSRIVDTKIKSKTLYDRIVVVSEAEPLPPPVYPDPEEGEEE